MRSAFSRTIPTTPNYDIINIKTKIEMTLDCFLYNNQGSFLLTLDI